MDRPPARTRGGLAGSLAGGLVVAALAGCSSAAGGAGSSTGAGSADGSPSPTSGLADARRAWSAAAIKDYDLAVDRQCLCDGSGGVRVSVRGGEVVEVVSLPAAAIVPGTEAPDGMPTSVEDLFAVIAREEATADRVTVTYGETGVPLSIDVDRRLGYVDDEERLAVAFTPDPDRGARAGTARPTG